MSNLVWAMVKLDLCSGPSTASTAASAASVLSSAGTSSCAGSGAASPSPMVEDVHALGTALVLGCSPLVMRLLPSCSPQVGLFRNVLLPARVHRQRSVIYSNILYVILRDFTGLYCYLNRIVSRLYTDCTASTANKPCCVLFVKCANVPSTYLTSVLSCACISPTGPGQPHLVIRQDAGTPYAGHGGHHAPDDSHA